MGSSHPEAFRLSRHAFLQSITNYLSEKKNLLKNEYFIAYIDS